MQSWEKNSWKMGELSIPLPIVQGGMGIGISLNGLASAVAEQGGIGVISAVGLTFLGEDRNITNEITLAKAKTKGIIGVNIMVALEDFSKLVQEAMLAGADVIFAGAGLPLDLPSLRIENCQTKLVPIISSGKAARLIAKRWLDKYNYLPDAFVLEGPLAGGHLGFKMEQLTDANCTLESLLLEVQEALEPFGEIPIIVAGGIYYGAEVAKYLELGASAVQLGSRFVTTEECDADIAFKKAYLQAKAEDVCFIASPVGLPGRAFNSDFLAAVKRGEKQPRRCDYNCLKPCQKTKAPYCIAHALLNARAGNLEEAFVFTGARGYLAEKIVSVAEVFASLKLEYEAR